jgi:hypothetical protein
MTRRFWTAVAGLAAAAAIVAVPSALAAYQSAKLQVTYAGAATVVKASLDPNDDPTASVRIYAPAGTQLTTNQAPGSELIVPSVRRRYKSCMSPQMPRYHFVQNIGMLSGYC